MNLSNDPYEPNDEEIAEHNRAEAIEQLARDLLARLSQDYGDSYDLPDEVQSLFDRGEALLPIKVDDVIVSVGIKQQEEYTTP